MSKKVTVEWNNPVDVTNLHHLEVWRKTGAGGSYAQIGSDIMTITSGTTLSYEDTNGGLGLADGQEYFYEVRCYNATGEYSALEDSITISGVYIAPPTSLAAGTPTSNTIPLTWTLSVTGVMTEYRVYDDGVLIETFVGDVNSGTLTGLTPSTNYTNLTVRAYNGSSESADSNAISATTDADVTAPTALYAYIDNAEPDTVTVVFSEAMTYAGFTNLVRGGANGGGTSPTGNATGISGDGTNIIKIQFGSAWTAGLWSLTISFSAGQTLEDLAGNAFAPAGPINIVNMIEGTGSELATAGAHSKLAIETNSIAMWTATAVTMSVETADTHSGLYAAKILSSSTGATCRGHLAVNVDAANNYKCCFWAKKVGGTSNGSSPALDGSSSASATATIVKDLDWRPFSTVSNDPTTSATAALRITNATSPSSVTGEYTLVDELTCKQY